MAASACCGSMASFQACQPTTASAAAAARGGKSSGNMQSTLLPSTARFIVQRRGAAFSHRVGVASAEVKFVGVEEAKQMVEKDGYTILDIRDKSQYERSHIANCVHIPYFIENTDNDIGTIINRQLHNNFSGLFYGLAFTKPNPDFVPQVTSKFPKDSSKLLLVCQEGLRSGYAAERLEGVGFQDVAYINSGLNKVAPGVFPKEGEKELQDAGKGGLVTIQGPVSRVVGAILVLAFLFLQFFPEQANELFFKS
ncbi:hypothetical protein Mapa_015429 [Marchantia paleacea]|nr:hypothetical protein Mapa_015429 [Marchantia paleacea]